MEKGFKPSHDDEYIYIFHKSRIELVLKKYDAWQNNQNYVQKSILPFLGILIKNIGKIIMVFHAFVKYFIKSRGNKLKH